MMTPVVQTETAVLAHNFQGELIYLGDAAYDEARAIWNGMIDRRPALIARCATVADVQTAVKFARETGWPLSVRGGGHNVAGHAVNDNGIVIDLSLMNSVAVDPDGHLAYVGGGATIADVDRATQAFGLAAPMGVVSETGVAGLTLGGGFGHLRNKYGLSADNLVAANVVTADGHIVHANEQENSDLLWGLRGGGGNFGIVTQFVYKLYPLGPEIYFTGVFHHGDHAEAGLKLYREFNAIAPDEVSTLAFLGIVPDGAEPFPPEAHGERFVGFVALYAGDPAEGEAIMRPLRKLTAEPLADFSGVMPYVDAQQFFDEDYPSGELRYYWKSLNLLSLNDEAIARIVEHVYRQPSQHSTTDLWHIGGAVKRFNSDHGAFYGRHAAYLLNPEANWEDAADDEANIAWAQTLIDAMAEFSDGSRYLNFAGFQEEGDGMMTAAFGPQYARLAQLKQKYDPTNLFNRNQNIKPQS
ncbi:FAD-binding oxidoreductase [Candidatus Leptofilum sp.]|uniref:FAD-binding oxidoreductase n=1 Tax=Candidatus Leptofilum sp. TaxID=3241576 RepID=UPI003B5C2077